MRCNDQASADQTSITGQRRYLCRSPNCDSGKRTVACDVFIATPPCPSSAGLCSFNSSMLILHWPTLWPKRTLHSHHVIRDRALFYLPKKRPDCCHLQSRQNDA
jgi:hypothetical protein